MHRVRMRDYRTVSFAVASYPDHTWCDGRMALGGLCRPCLKALQWDVPPLIIKPLE